jgi:hypothetical protein
MRSVSSGYRSGVNEIFALLQFYAAQIGSLLTTFRDNLSVPVQECFTLEDGSVNSLTFTGTQFSKYTAYVSFCPFVLYVRVV